MPYQVQIVSRAEREEKINNGLKAPIGELDFHDFRNTTVKLPRIKLPIGLPVYRMENFRTFTDQHEYLRKERKISEFFAKGQEIESVQQVQHDLLAALARKGVSDSVSPVIDILKKDKQREPILLTLSAVVVNGNRRLAAMRELLEEDASFSHVDCAILPADTTAEDILNIEAALQAKPETKLDYDWIGDAQLIASMVALHKNTTEVAKRLNRGDKEIKNALLALEEANLYLKDWADPAKGYSNVKEEAEQLFKDLPKQLEGKPPELMAASRAIAYTLFENKEKLPGRVYNFNSAFGKLAAGVLDKVASDLGVSTEPSSVNEDGQIFDIDMGEEDAPISYAAVIDVLKSGKEDETVVDTLIEAANNAVEMDKGQRSGQAALKAVQQAHAKLMSVDVQRAAPDTRGAMLKQLENISQLSAQLIAKLKVFTQE